MPKSVQVSIAILLFVLFVSGCHTPLAIKQIQAKNPLAKNAPKSPNKIVDVWNSYAQTTPDGKTMRGMAGRVHFYDEQKKSRAVKVDGDMTVYIFDGNESDPAHAKPLHVYHFKAETLNKHYANEKPFGHGYNFFLPIDEIGGEEKSLCIMVRFDDKLNGMFEIGTPINTVLAGRKPTPPVEPAIREYLESHSVLADADKSITTPHDTSVIQQVAHVSVKNIGEGEKSRVSTIPLNSDMTRRLIEAKDAVLVQHAGGAAVRQDRRDYYVNESGSNPVQELPLPERLQ